MSDSFEGPFEGTPRARRVAGFVRHGHFDRPEHVASAHLPLPLSPTGRRQVRAASETLLGHCDALGLEIDACIEASPLLRAWETARILADALESATGRAFEVVEQPDLMERSLGSCANLRFDEIEARLAADPRLGPLPPGWRRIPEFRLPVPGAESLLQAGARAAARIERSLASLPEKGPDGEPRDVMRLFVAHGGCLRHAALQLGVLDRRTVTALSMEHASAVLIERRRTGAWVHLAGEWKKRLLDGESAEGGGDGGRSAEDL